VRGHEVEEVGGEDRLGMWRAKDVILLTQLSEKSGFMSFSMAVYSANRSWSAAR
jgi:hypothetical protein